MKTILFLSVLLLGATGLIAQDITASNIRWQIDKAQEVNSGKIVGEQDRVVSYGTTKIEWQDAEGVVKKTFTISETNGSWTNVQNNGSILYEVNAGEQLGTVAIIRNATDFLIRITLVKADADPDIHELAIINFETL